MKKIQPIDESGRRMAMERYGDIEDRTKYGHSQMGRDMRPKFETPSYSAEQTARNPDQNYAHKASRGVALKHDVALPPAEPAMDAPSGAGGGSIKGAGSHIEARRHGHTRRGAPTHNHPHSHLKHSRND